MDNLEQIILLLVSGQGILLSIALLSNVIKRNYSSFCLGLITAVITIEVLNTWAMQIAYHSSENAFPFWVFGSYLILPSALWLFVKENTQPMFRFKSKYYILFVPAIIEIIIEFFSFYSNRFLSTGYELQVNPFWYAFTEVVPVVSMALVLVLFARELVGFKVRLKKVAATKITLQQVSKLHVLFAFFSFLTVFWSFQVLFQLEVFYIIEIVLLLFIFILGYIGYLHPSFFDIPKILKTEIMKEQFSQFDDRKELARLRMLFENEKIYIQQKLSLNDVAFHLNLPERYVSGLINSYHGTNFSSYVNSFRVAETLKRINDPKEKNKTLLGIALESGFNSKSSFNQIFKATTGKNPSDFLNM